MLHALTIKDIRQETQQAVVVEFDIPENLAQTFTFKAGQYVTVQADINGKNVRRAYSICSPPNSGKLQVGIKHIPDGVFSTYANTVLKVGDTLQVMPPQGQFVLPENTPQGGQYLMVCAGSGITPILSLCEYILNTDNTAQITLVYGNSYSHSIMFKEALTGLKNQFVTRFNLIHVLSREHQKIDLRSGRIDMEKISHIVKVMLRQKIDHAFVCGPKAIIDTVNSVCTAVGIDKGRIHFELFGTPTTPKKRKVIGTQKKHHISIIKSGSTTSFEMDTHENNILTAGINMGTDLPFACKAGVCSTCKCQVITGEVTMDLNYALPEEEVAQGYILSCQAYPVSPKVVVDFDV